MVVSADAQEQKKRRKRKKKINSNQLSSTFLVHVYLANGKRLDDSRRLAFEIQGQDRTGDEKVDGSTFAIACNRSYDY